MATWKMVAYPFKKMKFCEKAKFYQVYFSFHRHLHILMMILRPKIFFEFLKIILVAGLIKTTLFENVTAENARKHYHACAHNHSLIRTEHGSGGTCPEKRITKFIHFLFLVYCYWFLISRWQYIVLHIIHNLIRYK